MGKGRKGRNQEGGGSKRREERGRREEVGGKGGNMSLVKLHTLLSGKQEC